MISTNTHEVNNDWLAIHTETAGDLLIQLLSSEPVEVVVKQGLEPVTENTPVGLRLVEGAFGSLSISPMGATDVAYVRVRDEGAVSLVGTMFIPGA